MRALYIFPALIFLLLAILMGWKILDDKQDMRATAQTTRDDPLPEISLPLLDGNATLSNASFHGKISLLHFFASWCVSCVSERQEWESLRNETAFQRIAVAWNDPPEKTRAWLKKYGNAFDQVAIDRA